VFHEQVLPKPAHAKAVGMAPVYYVAWRFLLPFQGGTRLVATSSQAVGLGFILAAFQAAIVSLGGDFDEAG
jgi:hypothetical protein